MLAPVCPDLFRMKAEHGIAIIRVLTADIKDRVTGFEVDGRNEDFGDTGSTGTGHHFFAVGGKLLTIEVTMGIDE